MTKRPVKILTGRGVIRVTITASVTESATYKGYGGRETGDFAGTLRPSDSNFTVAKVCLRNH